jgi:diguanylate cyclase (GGDEF)-like protein/PAS domain S-box-containing protein
MSLQNTHQPRIGLVAGAILIVVTLLVGVSVFVVMQRHAEELLSKSLRSSLQNRVQLTQSEIEAGFNRVVVVATRPLLIEHMHRVDAGVDDGTARMTLNNAVQTFLPTGLTAIALFDRNGQELAHAGAFARKVKLAVPLNFPGRVQLMWDGQLLLHAVVDMKQGGRVVGKVIAETLLPTTTGAFKDASHLGKTAELVLSAPFGRKMQRFPSTHEPRVLTLSQRSVNGDLLAMAHALAGETGVVTTRDYRHQKVVAAYAPVGDLGLGMVLRMDSAELYAPVWNQLRYLIPLLLGVLVIALLLLRWLLTPLVVRLVRSEAEAAQRSAALSGEIAEHRQAEAEILRFKNVLDNTLDMIFMFEPDTLRFVYLNQGAVLNMGYSREEMLGMTPCQIKPLLPEPKFRQLIAPLLSGEQLSLHFETVHRRKDGSDFPVDIFLQLVKEGDGNRLFVEIMRDITQKKKTDELIWNQANFDTLTGLPNRRMFRDRLEQEIKKAHRANLQLALLFIDLDHFKEVNDTLGHNIGDILLIEAARRIGGCVRESDTVAHLGGDEFTVILSEQGDVDSVARIAQNIIDALVAPFQLDEERAFISASIGITFFPDDAADVDALLKNADQAMYAAKTQGRNRYHYFTSSMQETAKTRMRIANDLRGALADRQFGLLYQPIVTLANGAIHKAEALIRWQHPTRGLISPTEFIPVAEGTGMIVEIGDWVFREAASQAAHWRASHYAKFQISINVSPIQFGHKGANFKAWLEYMQELGLPGQSVVVEITEGLLMDAHASVTGQLLAFRDAGIRVSLDDFGTGYSSLSYLKKFHIDYLKIDQSFVHALESDSNDMALCEAIIVMAHKLGLKVIAEGVETEGQRNLLAAAGCDYGQGYLFSKPISSEEFETLLKKV